MAVSQSTTPREIHGYKVTTSGIRVVYVKDAAGIYSRVFLNGSPFTCEEHLRVLDLIVIQMVTDCRVHYLLEIEEKFGNPFVVDATSTFVVKEMN